MRQQAARQLLRVLRAAGGSGGAAAALPCGAAAQQQQLSSVHALVGVAAQQAQLWAEQQRRSAVAQPPRVLLQHRRGLAAPARALADSMADVAERKLSEAAQQFAALQAKLEGVHPGSDAYQRLAKESGALAPLAEGHARLQQLRAEADGLAELLDADGDKELQQLAREELAALEEQASELRQSLLLALLPPETCDGASVVLDVRASVGGEWAGDFAADLLEMYRRYAAEQGWRFEVLEARPTDLGGIKSATALVSGSGAFGQLRWESGVHRATMVPDNDKHGRMQTGTAVVVALPEASEVEVRIADSDLRIETCRASGKGGQHVNTTDSAVRIVHLPSGIAVTCQNERSQLQNKVQAMRVLRARLHEQELARQAASQSAARKAAAGLANTNERIRSYNYQDSRVTDHRVGLSLQVDVPRFMADGQRLDELIHAVRIQHQQRRLQELCEGED